MNMAREIYIQYPEINEVLFADAYVSRQKDKNIDRIPAVVIISKHTLKKDTRTKIMKWLRFRLEEDRTEMIFINR